MKLLTLKFTNKNKQNRTNCRLTPKIVNKKNALLCRKIKEKINSFKSKN